MKKSGISKFKKGAASFYIVAVSTLILVIVAASFAAVIVSEVTRTSNDDLSQSAYDAALAGVEDAKLTFYNYQKCKDRADKNLPVAEANGVTVTCGVLEDWVENGENADLKEQDSCDIVANSLGRTIQKESNGTKKGVLVQERNDAGNNMEQYYTCVDIRTKTDDYLGTLTSEDTEHSVRIKFDKTNNGNVYQDVDRVRVSWQAFSGNEESGGNSGNLFTWMTPRDSGVFNTEKVTPAVISVSMVQTSSPFSLSQFDRSINGETDRGTVYLVPVNDENALPSGSDAEGYYSAVNYNGGIGGYENKLIDNDHGFLKSNDKDVKNKPVLVWCARRPTTSGYACSATLEIPKPVGGTRNEDTLVFSVSLPYGGPKTDYSLEFYNSGNMNQPLKLDGVQVSIDSTGRANDLYRRVDTRLEASDAAYPYPVYGVEALNPGAQPGIKKNFDTTCEYNYDDKTCS